MAHISEKFREMGDDPRLLPQADQAARVSGDRGLGALSSSIALLGGDASPLVIAGLDTASRVYPTCGT